MIRLSRPAAAGCVCALLLAAAAPAASARAADRLADRLAARMGPPHGVWEGSASCGDGTRHFRLSIEPGERGARAVVDLLDAAGGRPWARAEGKAAFNAGQRLLNLAPQWIVAPLDEPRLSLRLKAAEDWTALRGEGLRDCQELRLDRAAPAAATGGIAAATELPPLLAGTLACGNGRPVARLDLRLAAEDERKLGGTMTVRAHPDAGATEEGSFAVFGEYDAEAGVLTLVGDQWEGASGRRGRGQAFDLTGELRDGGRRLSATAALPSCSVVDLAVPGSGVAAHLQRPVPPRPVLDWNDPSACATLVDWAGQALSQTDADSLYGGTSARAARQIGIGLLADSRFVPFFGKPFEELSAAEKRHVFSVGRQCGALGAFASPMRHSGAAQFVTDFFGRMRPDMATAASRVRLLQERLSDEMAAIEARTVGEPDIPGLEERRAELDHRYEDLWPADRAEARALIEAKLAVARGEMADRIAAGIAALPDDWPAFAAERSIRADIARLRDAQAQRRRLDSALDSRLAAVADTLLVAMVADMRDLKPDLQGLAALRSVLDSAWLRLGDHAAEDGKGLAAVRMLAHGLAQPAYAAFEARAQELMKPAPFEEREARYRDLVHLRNSVVPQAAPLREIFARYDALVGSLRPVPTAEDLVAADGSPSALGMKLAVGRYLEEVYAVTSSLFPGPLGAVFDRITDRVRVSTLRRVSCDAADAGGWWCGFDLQIDAPIPMVRLIGLTPSRARFARRGDGWGVVEVPGGQGGGDASREIAMEQNQRELERIKRSAFESNMIALMR